MIAFTTETSLFKEDAGWLAPAYSFDLCISKNKLYNYTGTSLEIKRPIGQDKELANPSCNVAILY